MSNMRAWLLVMCAACARTGASTSPCGAETALAFEGTCDTDTAQRFPIDEREHVAIVTCSQTLEEPDGDGNKQEMISAYLVRRSSSATRGTSIELGSWTVEIEQGEYFEIDSVLRDARGRATHVLVRHGRGGLDQIPELDVRAYLPASGTFATKTYSAVKVDVEVAANGAAARIVMCRLAPGGTYDQMKTCEQQQGAIIETATVP
jgi:hypothetical protein